MIIEDDFYARLVIPGWVCYVRDESFTQIATGIAWKLLIRKMKISFQTNFTSSQVQSDGNLFGDIKSRFESFKTQTI